MKRACILMRHTNGFKNKKMTTYYSHWNVGGTQDFCIFNFTKIPSTFSFYCRDDVITPEVCLMQMRCEVLRFQQENGNAKHKRGKVWKQVRNVQLCLGCPEYHFIFLVRSLKNYILKCRHGNYIFIGGNFARAYVFLAKAGTTHSLHRNCQRTF